MAYFLKKTKNKKGLYLQIYESHWDPERGHTVNRSVRAIGYEHELKESGIADPIAHFKAEVASMNAERKAKLAEEKAREMTYSELRDYLTDKTIAYTDKMMKRWNKLAKLLIVKH